MKCLIIRTGSTKIDFKTYNLQEMGLAKALIRKGHICDIIYYAFDGNYKEEIIEFDNGKKLRIYWLNGKSFLNNAIFNKKKLLEICNNYDVIQVAEYDQYTSFLLCKTKNISTVIYHGPYYCEFKKKYNFVNKFFDKIFLKKYLKIQPNIITKSRLAEEYLRKKGFNNVTTVGVGIDRGRFSETEKTNEEVENLIRQIENRKIILYIGQMEERRSVNFIIRTYAKVLRREKDTVLLIIGKGKNDYVEKCKNLVKELKIEDNVIFKTKINQEFLPKIYKKSSVFLLPTKYEIFGMVLLEAMNFGIPLITTYNGGSSTLIEDGKNGFIINELNDKKWANKIIEILNNNNEGIVYEASNSINDFTWDKLVDRFINIYKDTINRECGKNEKE